MKEYEDQLLKYNDWICGKIQKENLAQISKWGVQKRTAFEWITYLTEELGELAEAISEHEYRGASKEEVVKEAIQVATLALKIAEIFDVDI